MSKSQKSNSVSDKFLSNKSIYEKSKANVRQIQDALIGSQQFLCLSHFETPIAFLFNVFSVNGSVAITRV